LCAHLIFVRQEALLVQALKIGEGRVGQLLSLGVPDDVPLRLVLSSGHASPPSDPPPTPRRAHCKSLRPPGGRRPPTTRCLLRTRPLLPRGRDPGSPVIESLRRGPVYRASSCASRCRAARLPL